MSAPAWRKPNEYPMPESVLNAVPSPELEAVLADWRLWQQAAGLSARTMNERASVIRTLMAFTERGPLELTPRDIVDFLSRPGLSVTSKHTYHCSINAYSRHLVSTGQRSDNPALAVPKPKRRKPVPRPIEPWQLEATIQSVESRRAHVRKTRMQLLLAAFAGLRIHEIAKIRGEDLNRSAGVLYVVGKGLKSAALPIHPRILEAAEDFPTSGYWFPSFTVPGAPVTPKAVAENISNAMKEVGVIATPHQIRHLFGTSLVRNGVDLRTVQELMRHENLTTTQIYCQVSDDSRMKAIAGLAYTGRG